LERVEADVLRDGIKRACGLHEAGEAAILEPWTLKALGTAKKWVVHFSSFPLSRADFGMSHTRLRGV
jgi:hypothetical protein